MSVRWKTTKVLKFVLVTLQIPFCFNHIYNQFWEKDSKATHFRNKLIISEQSGKVIPTNRNGSMSLATVSLSANLTYHLLHQTARK